MTIAGVEVLVQVAELTLELQSYRKAARRRPIASRAPVAAHADPRVPARLRLRLAMPPPHRSGLDTRLASAARCASAACTGGGRGHDRARRFAKLLVDEIKLYNQTKVAEGRNRCDLYSRLHEDIEKSRAACTRNVMAKA